MAHNQAIRIVICKQGHYVNFKQLLQFAYLYVFNSFEKLTLKIKFYLKINISLCLDGKVNVNVSIRRVNSNVEVAKIDDTSTKNEIFRFLIK